MKFKKPIIDEKGNLHHRSADDCFTIIKPASQNREAWWLEMGDQYAVREGKLISLPPTKTFTGAIEVCELHADLKKQVFPYFLERARYEIRRSKNCVKNSKIMNSASIMSRQLFVRQAAASDIEEAESLYRYNKYRAFLTTRTGIHIDPSEWRNWQAMLSGTYVQWWEAGLQLTSAQDQVCF